jgi:hypothetical protein
VLHRVRGDARVRLGGLEHLVKQRGVLCDGRFIVTMRVLSPNYH